jgi:hypothetical protein
MLCRVCRIGGTAAADKGRVPQDRQRIATEHSGTLRGSCSPVMAKSWFVGIRVVDGAPAGMRLNARTESSCRLCCRMALLARSREGFIS